MAVRIQVRRDLAANFTAANPILAQGEIGFETDANQFKIGDGVTAWNALAYTLAAGGETNTGSNVGTDGVGVFDGKVVADLQFRHIAPASNKISVTLDAGDNDIDLDIVEANIVHANISGVGTNTHAQIDTHIADATLHFTEASIDHTNILNIGTNTHAQIDTHIANADIHVDHTAVNINTAANSGLAGGGDISASRSLSVSPNNATDTTIAAGDEILFGDVSDSNNVKKDTVQGILDLVPASSDELVGVSANDTTPGYLLGKITSSDSSVTLTEVNDGGDEDLNLAVDHVNIANIGTNTHAQIDSHIADATLHFTEASIDHTNILNIGTNTHAQIDTHIADSTIHFTAASLGLSGLTDNRLIRADGTSAIQDSGITVDDSDNVSGVGTLDTTGDITITKSTPQLYLDDTADEPYTITATSGNLTIISDSADYDSHVIDFGNRLRFNENYTFSGGSVNPYIDITGTQTLSGPFNLNILKAMVFAPTVEVSTALFAALVVDHNATYNINVAQFGTVTLFSNSALFRGRGGMSTVRVYNDLATVTADTAAVSSTWDSYTAGPTFTANASQTLSVSYTAYTASFGLSAATGGAATITTYNGFLCDIGTVSGAGTKTITTANYINLVNDTNPVALNGVRSNLNTNGGATLFINHTGTANSNCGPDNAQFRFGTGQDASIYYDGTDFILDPDLVGSGRVLIGATGDDDLLLNDIEIDGDLNHDGSGVGFYGTSPVAQSAAYTPSNVTTDRSYDANSTTIDEVADVLGTLIADLQATGLIG